jgi:hypothetical protein
MTRRTHPIQQRLPELCELESLIEEGHQDIRVSVASHVAVDGHRLPIYALEMGSRDTDAPTMALIGGIHGVERIGTQIILAYLKTLLRQHQWDNAFYHQLEDVRLLLIPLVNPGGMYLNRRSNPNGVDLMRNAPIDANVRPPWPLGGQRLTRHLPWYRGKESDAMEAESQALSDVVAKTLFQQHTCITLDCHSGFGSRDRIWFPYAGQLSPWPELPEMHGLTRLFEHTYPHHNLYLFEPQAHSYCTHGDLWDFLYDQYKAVNPGGTFLPLTLEMGSWLWLKKNPAMIFKYQNLFNPVLPHRQQRIMRRHLTLFEFLLAAVRNVSAWCPQSEAARHSEQARALARWYPAFSHKTENPSHPPSHSEANREAVDKQEPSAPFRAPEI